MWEKIRPVAITAVVIAVAVAAMRLTTTVPYHRHYHDPVYFVLVFVESAISYVAIACFLAIFPWLAVGAIIEAWSNPPPLREMLWLPVYVAMAIAFGIATVAWVIGPFAPSISGYVWDTRLW
ncbi:MAG: hypothetical protein WCA22_14400 [Candidatus Binatus sp.]